MDNMPLCGIDNVRILKKISDVENEKMVLLSSPAGLIKYPIGKGGIVLNQIDIKNNDGFDFDPLWLQKGKSSVKINSIKKKIAVYATLLTNMGAKSRINYIQLVPSSTKLSSKNKSKETILAEDILRETQISGGLIVHLGSNNGKLTAELYANKSYE